MAGVVGIRPQEARTDGRGRNGQIQWRDALGAKIPWNWSRVDIASLYHTDEWITANVTATFEFATIDSYIAGAAATIRYGAKRGSDSDKCM